MQQDLVVAKSLNDIGGECRAHGNMGAAHFSKGNFKEALTSHRYQLVLAMKCKDSQAAASALTSLGHVYTAIGDYQNALASHKQCVDMVRTQINDKLQVNILTSNKETKRNDYQQSNRSYIILKCFFYSNRRQERLVMLVLST